MTVDELMGLLEARPSVWPVLATVRCGRAAVLKPIGVASVVPMDGTKAVVWMILDETPEPVPTGLLEILGGGPSDGD